MCLELAEYDRQVREAVIRILGCPLGDLAWEQAKLPVSMGGLGLRAATDHSAAAYASSFLASQPLARQLLRLPDEQEDPILNPQVIASLNARTGEEEVTQDSLKGLKQKQVSAMIDLVNQKQLLATIAESGDEREIARLASICLPKAGVWLNCSPLPALGLHLRGAEFVVCCKFRLGLPVYDLTSQDPAQAVARTVIYWVTTAWSVAQVVNAL